MFWRTVSNSELSAPNEDGNNFSYPLIDLHDPQPEAVPANADRAVYLWYARAHASKLQIDDPD